MISRRNLSKTQRFALAAIDVSETLSRFAPSLITAAIVISTAFFIQRELNRKVEAKCDPSIYVLVKHPTSAGPVYYCMSRAQLKGPAPTFKP